MSLFPNHLFRNVRKTQNKTVCIWSFCTAIINFFYYNSFLSGITASKKNNYFTRLNSLFHYSDEIK